MKKFIFLGILLGMVLGACLLQYKIVHRINNTGGFDNYVCAEVVNE